MRSVWTSVGLAVVVLFVVEVGACINANPAPPVPTQTSDAGVPYVDAFADSVLAYTQSGVGTSCIAGLPNCTTSKVQTSAACGDNAAIGPNDGRFFNLGTGDTITLAFTCSSVLGIGSMNDTPSNDFRVFGTVSDGAYGTVEVSEDASYFQSLNQWAPADMGGYVTDPYFSLAAVTGLNEVRYLRITNTGQSGTVAIDAVEALRAVIQ